ncbi:MAG: radical SAM protein [Synergistaceae bacterium]|jgi:pyruvate formate lyase activating enzyme|nr:radical SAM protein [Synergistaceae bacterium]
MADIEPRWWSVSPNDTGDSVAVCSLCFRNCAIGMGREGLCGTRRFTGAGFESPLLGKFSSTAIDPIEKKPLYHWRPGTKILSLGSLGCNFFCPFCQNHSIAHPHGERELQEIPPAILLETAKRYGLSSVAYTYNEPSLQAEYILAAAPLLRKNGVSSVMVTNGAFSEVVRDELAFCVEAMNIDVKTFNDAGYEKLGLSRDAMKAVTSNVEALVSASVHVEITNLVVPEISDNESDFSDMVDWIADISPAIPLHISRYFPAYRYQAPTTDVKLMKKFLATAEKKLKHVHLGNVW